MFRLGFRIESMRVTLSIDDDVHHLIKAEARRTCETMGAVLSRVCRDEIIKILIDSKRPFDKRLYRSSNISFQEYSKMKGFEDIIQAEGL